MSRGIFLFSVVMYTLFILPDCSSVSQSLNKDSITSIENLMMDEGCVRGGEYTGHLGERLLDAKNGAALLFFRLDWCTHCKNTEGHVTDDLLPDNLVVLKLDSSTALNLKTKYNATATPVFAHMNEKGGIIKKWSGTGFAGYKRSEHVRSKNNL